MQRSTTKWVSLFDLSVQDRFTWEGSPGGHVPVKPIGAAGVAGVPSVITAVLDTESADMVGKPGVTVSPTTGPIAQTRYQYARLFCTVLVERHRTGGEALVRVYVVSPTVKFGSSARSILYWVSFSEWSVHAESDRRFEARSR